MCIKLKGSYAIRTAILLPLLPQGRVTIYYNRAHKRMSIYLEVDFTSTQPDMLQIQKSHKSLNSRDKAI